MYTFPEDEDVQIQKAWNMLNFQGWFTLVHEPTNACTSLVRDFYKNLSVISSKNPAQLHSSACQLWWGGRDVFITLDQFTKILKLPTDEEGLKFHSKQNWPKRSTEALKCVFPHMGVEKKAHSTQDLPVSVNSSLFHHQKCDAKGA